MLSLLSPARPSKRSSRKHTFQSLTGHFPGITKPVPLKATFNGEIDSHAFAGVPEVGVAAEGNFKRTDFGQPVGYVGHDVTIRFDGEFIQDTTAKRAVRDLNRSSRHLRFGLELQPV